MLFSDISYFYEKLATKGQEMCIGYVCKLVIDCLI